jgi:catechol 2,3-dioxygenase-like lactoylglutathione lyase family enzyme
MNTEPPVAGLQVDHQWRPSYAKRWAHGAKRDMLDQRPLRCAEHDLNQEARMPSYKLNPTVAIEVPDCEKALRFYKSVLGMSEVGQSVEGEGACLKKGDVTIFLLNGSDGNAWLRLTADDLDGAKKQLEENGCQLSPVPGGYLVVDPHGTRFYLTGEEGERNTQD